MASVAALSAGGLSRCVSASLPRLQRHDLLARLRRLRAIALPCRHQLPAFLEQVTTPVGRLYSSAGPPHRLLSWLGSAGTARRGLLRQSYHPNEEQDEIEMAPRARQAHGCFPPHRGPPVAPELAGGGASSSRRRLRGSFQMEKISFAIRILFRQLDCSLYGDRSLPLVQPTSLRSTSLQQHRAQQNGRSLKVRHQCTWRAATGHQRRGRDGVDKHRSIKRQQYQCLLADARLRASLDKIT
jgi:hypothetical protein